jgi:hypothetical protein
VEELEHPSWCDPIHCTATPQKPHYRAGETGFHRSTPVVLQGIPNVGDVVFDAEINPVTAHLAQAGPPWEPVPHLNLGTVDDPQLLSLTADAAEAILRELGRLVALASAR